MSPVFQREALVSVYIYSFIFAVNFGISSFQAILPAIQRYDLVNTYYAFQSMSTGLLQMIVLIKFPSLLNYSLATLASTVLQVGLLLYLVKKSFGLFTLKTFDMRLLRRLFSFSVFVLGMQAGYTGRDYFDRWVLNTLRGSASLPGYIFSQNIMSRIRSFLAGACHFVFPLFSSMSVSLERRKLLSIFDSLHWAVSSSGCLCYCLILVNAFWLLEFLVSMQFAEAHTAILQLACVQGCFSVFSIIPHLVALGLNKPINNFIEAVVCGGLVVVLAIVLMPRYGVLGAAVAQIISYGSVVGILHGMLRKNIFHDLSLFRVIQPIVPGLIVVTSVALVSCYLHNNATLPKGRLLEAVLANSFVVFMGIAILAWEKISRPDSPRLSAISKALSVVRNAVAGQAQS